MCRRGDLIEAAVGGGDAAPAVAAGSGDRMIAQLRSLLAALSASRYRNRLALLAAGIVVVICANSVGQIWLNVWQGSFFDAIEQRDLATFGGQLLVFCLIVGALLVLVVAQTWLKEMLQVRLREWLTHDLLDQWLAPKRAYLLAHAGEIGSNPDQRVHEDTRHLVDLSTNLAVGLLQATLLLLSFVGVLGCCRRRSCSRSAITASVSPAIWFGARLLTRSAAPGSPGGSVAR